MKCWTGTYQKSQGWSEPLPDMDSDQTLVLIFGAPEFKTEIEPFEAIKKKYPNSKIMGCSTSGEIYHDTVLDHALSVAVVQFENTKLALAHDKLAAAKDSFHAGETLSKVLQGPDLKAILVLSEGLLVNGSDLVAGLNKSLKPGITISGGLAGDGDKFNQTWILVNGLPYVNAVSALGLYGKDLEVGYGSEGGWDQFGLERTITQSKNNVVYEIDGMPALDLYKEYLGDRAKELPASALLFPLAISEKPESPHKIVRTILAVDEEQKSLTFAGNVPEGWCAQLMQANLDRLIDGAILAGKQATQAHQPLLSVAISCVGRRLVLGERTEEEVEGVLSMLSTANQIGFYSYGEISPKGFTNCDLHNQTMTITTFSERSP